ncbi:FecR family protein [Parabacteroides sp.]
MESESTYIIANGPDSSAVLRYIRNIASEEEKAQVGVWLKEDPEHERVLLQIARIYYANRTHERVASRNWLKGYRAVEKKINNRRRRLWFYRVSTIAVCFIGVLTIITIISFFLRESSTAVPQHVTVCANKGVRTCLELPDGSVVYLNSGSTLSYPVAYDEKERRVILSGEAYFSVKHDPDHPFVVSVSGDRMNVKVLGTEFNVQAYEGEDIIQTTLVTGSIDIEMKDANGMSKEVNLSPSEKAIYDLSNNVLDVLKVDVMNEIAWKEGRLVFKETPLPEVLKHLANFYNVDFKIQDTILNSYRFTGTFKNRELSQVLDYLRISSRIDYMIKRMETDDSSSEQRELVLLRKRRK